MNYGTNKVREYLHTYAQMVHLVDTFPGGVMSEKSRELVKTVIARAREFPDELKDKRFERTLIGLENIVQGLPYDSTNELGVFGEHSDLYC